MSIAVDSIRLWYRFTGTVAPTFAASKAADLFLTPFPKAKPTRWPEELQSQATESTIEFQGETLPVWTFGEGPKVLLCHGWRGCVGQYSKFVQPLLDQGFSVVAFDGPAHGASRAKRTNLVEFTALIQALNEKFGGFVAAIGHSFGGSSLVYSVYKGLRLERLVLIAPFSKSDENVDKFASFLRFSPALKERTRGKLKEFFGEDIAGWHLAPLADGLDTPLLLIHDENDEEVAYSEGQEIASHWPGAKHIATQGLGHRRILRSEDTAKAAVEFLSAIAPK